MAQRYQLPRSGSRINGLLGPLGAVGGTSGPDELNRFGLEAASVWASVGAAATEAVGVFAAPGGRSSPPLRPQPASASTAMPRRMTAHPEDFGHRLRFTIESPIPAAPYKDCLVLASAGKPRNCSEIYSISPIFAVFR